MLPQCLLAKWGLKRLAMEFEVILIFLHFYLNNSGTFYLYIYNIILLTTYIHY